jgi:hypothetical protein
MLFVTFSWGGSGTRLSFEVKDADPMLSWVKIKSKKYEFFIYYQSVSMQIDHVIILSRESGTQPV